MRHHTIRQVLAISASPNLLTGFAWAALPTGFADSRVATIAQSTALAFTPDGRMLIATQPGRLHVYQDGALLPTPAADLSLDSRVCSNFERGLLGVAVDPNFSTNHFVYLFYTFNKFGICPLNDPMLPQNPVNRVSRFTVTDNTVNLGSERVLIDNIPSPKGNHAGGDLHFGKDGLLYVSVGDGGCDYAGDSGCQTVNDAARDPNTVLGKILRVTRDGAIPADNPFVGANSARCGQAGVTAVDNYCQEIYATGLRNPFRIAFDPNGTVTRFFINDVGQNHWEEIDLGRGAPIMAGTCVKGPVNGELPRTARLLPRAIPIRFMPISTARAVRPSRAGRFCQTVIGPPRMRDRTSSVTMNAARSSAWCSRQAAVTRPRTSPPGSE